MQKTTNSSTTMKENDEELRAHAIFIVAFTICFGIMLTILAVPKPNKQTWGRVDAEPLCKICPVHK